MQRLYKKAISALSSATLRHNYYDPSGEKVGKATIYGSNTSASNIYTWYVRDARGNVMAVYQTSGSNIASTPLILLERYMYGSSRLGSIYENRDMSTDHLAADNSNANLGTAYLTTFTRGKKFFEVSNHLGTIMTILNDRRTPLTSGGVVTGYSAVMQFAADYTPFGMEMLGRAYGSSSSPTYRYKFNGKERIYEINGRYNHYDYGMRIYDDRLGRFFSVDPLTSKYPMLTPYQFASNTPIQAIDLDGLEAWVVVKTTIKDKTYLQLKFDKDLINEGGVYYVHRWMDPKTAGFVASESSGSVGYSEYPQYFPNFANGVFDAANFTNFRKAFSIKGEANILFAEAGLEGKLGGVGLGGSFGGNGKLIGLNVNTDDATGSVPFAGWQSTFRENDQTLDVGAGVSYGAGISYRHKYDLKKDKFKNQNEIGYNGLVTSGTIDGYSEKSTISFGVGGKAALGFGVNFEGKFVIDMDKLNKVLKARGIQFTQYEQVQQNSTEKGTKEFDPNKY
jgi:RHS repeat-associated protein